MLVGTLVVIALAALITRSWRTAAWAAVLAMLSAVVAIGWLLFAAPETWAYLRPFAEGTIQSLRGLLAGQTGGPPTSVGPLSNRLLAATAALIVSALLPVGWWQIWRRHRRQPWTVALAIVSASWYVIVAVRFTVADGSQLAGRAATFTFVPAAYVVALAVGYIASSAMRWQARIVSAAVLVVVLLFLFDGLVNGWPPYWERLPGPHQVAGNERSIGARRDRSGSVDVGSAGAGEPVCG